MKDDFGALMSKARASAGMSLRELQHATSDRKHKQKGVSLGLLSMIESGQRLVTYDACLKIASALSLDISEALSAAYRSRVNYRAKREKEALEAFARQKRLTAELKFDV